MIKYKANVFDILFDNNCFLPVLKKKDIVMKEGKEVSGSLPTTTFPPSL